MKIQILSDLHLEISKFKPSTPSIADVVVLAGDIANGTDGIIWARKSGYYRVAGSIGFRLSKLKYVKWGLSRDGGHEGWLITDQGKAALVDFDSFTNLSQCNQHHD